MKGWFKRSAPRCSRNSLFWLACFAFWGFNFANWGMEFPSDKMSNADTRALNRAGILARAGFLTGYEELARSLGLDPRVLIRSVGLDRFNLNDPDALIPAAAANELLERSTDAAGIEDFGLRLA